MPVVLQGRRIAGNNACSHPPRTGQDYAGNCIHTAMHGLHKVKCSTGLWPVSRAGRPGYFTYLASKGAGAAIASLS